MRTVIALFLLAFLFVCLSLTLPYVKEKKAPDDPGFDASLFTAPSENEERVLLIDNSHEALIRRLSLINSAEKEIFLATFELYGDESGKDILSALHDAAERGVKVTLLVDGYSENKLTKSDYLKELALSENAFIYFYNPYSILHPWRAQARMHEKCLIVDRSVYITGGRNTTDKFLGDYSSSVNSDRDILVYTGSPGENSSVTAVAEHFDSILAGGYCERYVYSGEGFHDKVSNRYTDVKINYPEAFAEFDPATETIAVGRITLITGSDLPQNKEPLVWKALTNLMSSGADITIISPYIMCGSDMYRDLTGICTGRNVRLIINSPYTGSNPFGNADYLNCREKVIATGATIFEKASGKASHVKTILIDDRLSVIGSFNFDMRSAYINSEMMLVIDSEELCGTLKANAEEELKYCREVLPDGEYENGELYEHPVQSVPEKAKGFLMRGVVRAIRYLL